MGIGRIALTFYVGFNIFAIVASLILPKYTLDRSDWWMFIVSCGILAICEALEVED